MPSAIIHGTINRASVCLLKAHRGTHVATSHKAALTALLGTHVTTP